MREKGSGGKQQRKAGGGGSKGGANQFRRGFGHTQNRRNDGKGKGKGKAKGGHRHQQRQGYSRDKRDYDDRDYEERSYDERDYDEDEDYDDWEGLDVDEVCQQISTLPSLADDARKRETRRLWLAHFDQDRSFQAFLEHFPPETEERQNLQSAFEKGLKCFQPQWRTILAEKLTAEGFEGLEQRSSGGKQRGKQKSREGGDRKVLLKQNRGQKGEWEPPIGSNPREAAPWQSKRRTEKDTVEKKSLASRTKLSKIDRSRLIVKASTFTKKAKSFKNSFRNKGKWQEQGVGELKGITGANLIEVKWKRPGHEDEDSGDEKAESPKKSPSPVRRGPAGRGRSMTAPAWMTAASEQPAPGIADDSKIEGGRGSRDCDTRVPSIPRELKDKEEDDEEDDDRQSRRKGNGKGHRTRSSRSRSGGKGAGKSGKGQRRAVLRANSAHTEASDRRNDRKDDENQATVLGSTDRRNSRDAQKADAWRGDNRWERKTYDKWKERSDIWPSADETQKDSDLQLATIVTTFLCSRHNVKRSFHRLIEQNGSLVCREGHPCILERTEDGEWIDTIDCQESRALKRQGELETNGDAAEVPLSIENGCSEPIPERKRPRAARTVREAVHRHLEVLDQKVFCVSAKSSSAAPPSPRDRERDSRSSAAGRPVANAPPTPPPPAPPARNSQRSIEAALEGSSATASQHHRDRESRRDRDPRDRDRDRDRERDDRDRDRLHHHDRERRRRRSDQESRDRDQDRVHHVAAPGSLPPGPPPAFSPPVYPYGPGYPQGYQLPPPATVPQPQQAASSGGREPKGSWRSPRKRPEDNINMVDL